MLSKALIDEIAFKMGRQQKELIEKDLVLHQLLWYLSQNKFFKDHFAFKGGTSLVKCFFGYLRFSEVLESCPAILLIRKIK